MSRAIKTGLLLLVALLLGGLLSGGLFFSINLLAQAEPKVVEEKPLLVLNLMQLPAKSLPKPKKIIPKKNPPIKIPSVKKKVKKTPKKKIVKKVVKKKIPLKITPPKPVEKPQPQVVEAVTKAVAVPDKQVESLPTPEPIFKLTELPHFLHREAPIYPETMRTAGRSGVVKLEALIDKKGRVRRVTIIKSAGAAFDRAAKTAILASSFSAAKIGEEMVAVRLRLPVRFSLR